MASFIEFLQENPLYIIGIAFLLIFFIVSLIKKAVKLLVVAVILFISYSYYLNDTFDSYQLSGDRLQSLGEKAKEFINETKG